jgi:O-antigen/teichoic acid export membrane protein
MVANTLETGDSSTVRRLLRGIAAATVFAAFMSALVLAAASKWLMRAYGEAFTSGWLALSILALAYAVAACVTLCRIILVSAGRMWIQNLHTAIWGIALIGAALLFSSHGAIGLAAAYMCAFTVALATQGWSALAVVRRRARGSAPGS